VLTGGLARDSIATLRDTAAQDVALVALPLDGEAQLEPELGQIGAARVAEFDVLQIVPSALVGIKFRATLGVAPTAAGRRPPALGSL
jgi:hypothetical protein